jgi:hypothetical protein
MLVVGEVHANLLRERDPVTGDHARYLLDLIPGEHVQVRERPLSYVRSAERPLGVDCPLGAPGSARRVRGVGTVVHRAAITGGHALQSSAYATVVRGERGARGPWAHYLARPGVIETIGRTRWPELAESFASYGPAAITPDLGAIAGRAFGEVQRRAGQNLRYRGEVRLRATRIRLRWVALIEPERPGPPGVGYTVYRDGRRFLRLTVGAGEVADLVAIAEDVALHDWLLTALADIVEKAAIGVRETITTIERLLPAIRYLLPLWMPGARGEELSDQLWLALDRRPGFSRQWVTLVNRIRDELAVAALTTAVRG